MNVRTIIYRFLETEADADDERRTMFLSVSEGLRLGNPYAVKQVRGLRQHAERPVHGTWFLDDNGDPFVRIFLEDGAILDFFYRTTNLLVVVRPDFYAG